MKQLLKTFLLGTIGILLTVISFFIPNVQLRRWARIIAAILLLIDIIRMVRVWVANNSIKSPSVSPSNQVAAIVADTLAPSTNNAVALVVAQNVPRGYSAIPQVNTNPFTGSRSPSGGAYNAANISLF